MATTTSRSALRPSCRLTTPSTSSLRCSTTRAGIATMPPRLSPPMVGNIISEIAPYLGVPTDPDYVAPDTVLVQNCIDNRWSTAQMNLNKVGLAHPDHRKRQYNPVPIPVRRHQRASRFNHLPVHRSHHRHHDHRARCFGPHGRICTADAARRQPQRRFSGDENGRVTAQDIAAGQSVEYGNRRYPLTMGAAESDTGMTLRPALRQMRFVRRRIRRL